MTKTTKNMEITEEEINEEIENGEEQLVSPIEVEKPKRTKKDRSPAQQEAFKKCLEARKKRAEEQLALKEKKQQISNEIDEEVEEHIETVKKQSKPKRKKKIIV